MCRWPVCSVRLRPRRIARKAQGVAVLSPTRHPPQVPRTFQLVDAYEEAAAAVRAWSPQPGDLIEVDWAGNGDWAATTLSDAGGCYGLAFCRERMRPVSATAATAIADSWGVRRSMMTQSYSMPYSTSIIREAHRTTRRHAPLSTILEKLSDCSSDEAVCVMRRSDASFTRKRGRKTIRVKKTIVKKVLVRKTKKAQDVCVV